MADSRVVKRRVNDSYRCVYCNQQFNKLEDSRTLLCLHVYCMRYLKTNISYRKTHMKCAYCGKEVYDIIDPTTLPVAKFGDSIEYRSPAKPVPIPSDVCEDGTEAVVFCVESEKKFCEQHQQKHDEAINTYLNTRCQFIPIDVYSASPQRYTTTNCEHHEHHQLIETCSECHKIFCIWCDSKSRCGKVAEGKAASHITTPLNDLSSKLRDKLTGEMKILSEKISELNEISKDTWRQLNEIEEGVKKMFARVYATANAKIEEIKKRAEELKEELSEYLKSSTEMAVNYRYDLAVKHGVDKLSLVDRVQHAVDKFNNAGIVKDYKEMSEKMKNALDISLIEKCYVPLNFLTSAGSEDCLGLKLLQPLAFLQSNGYSAATCFFTVNISADGHLMCGTLKGAEVGNRHTLDTISSMKHSDPTLWVEIIQPEGVVVSSCYKWNESSAEVTLLHPKSLKKTNSLYKQSVDRITFYKIAHHLSLVYIVDKREKQLVVYNLVDNKIQKFPLLGMMNPNSMHPPRLNSPHWRLH